MNQDSYLGDTNTPPSLHRYLYAYGNPTVYIDPDGHAPVTKQFAEFLRHRGEDQDNSARQLNEGLRNSTSLWKDAGIRSLNAGASIGGFIFDTLAAGANLVDLAADAQLANTPYIRNTAVGRESAERIGETTQTIQQVANQTKQGISAFTASHDKAELIRQASSSAYNQSGQFLNDVFIEGDLVAQDKFVGNLYGAAIPAGNIGSVGSLSVKVVVEGVDLTTTVVKGGLNAIVSGSGSMRSQIGAIGDLSKVKIGDSLKYTNTAPKGEGRQVRKVVWGENMEDRVIPHSKTIEGGDYYKPRGEWTLERNTRWAKDMKRKADRGEIELVPFGIDPERSIRSKAFLIEYKTFTGKDYGLE